MLFVNEMSECDTINNVSTQAMPLVVTKDAYHTGDVTVTIAFYKPFTV